MNRIHRILSNQNTFYIRTKIYLQDKYYSDIGVSVSVVLVVVAIVRWVVCVASLLDYGIEPVVLVRRVVNLPQSAVGLGNLEKYK